MGDLESIEVECKKFRDVRFGASSIAGFCVGSTFFFGGLELINETNFLDYLYTISDITEATSIGILGFLSLAGKAYSSTGNLISRFR